MISPWIAYPFLYLLVGFIYAVTVNVLARRLPLHKREDETLVQDMVLWPFWLLAIIVTLVYGLLQAIIAGTIGLIEYLIGGKG